MKKLFYCRERTLPFHLAFVTVFTFLYVDLYVIRADSIDVKYLLIAAVCIIVPLCYIAEGVILLHRRKKCISEGRELEGTVVGKVGVTMFSGGYCYRLVVRYKGGETVTPPLQAKYADRLKSRKCTVCELGESTYVTGFTLCKRGEEPVEIRVMHKSGISKK